MNDGDTSTFNPASDVLQFDVGTAALGISYDSGFTNVTFTLNGKAVKLPPAVSVMQLTTTNLIFADGSWLMVGDNLVSTTDDGNANTLIAGSGADQLPGLAGSDVLVGDQEDDLLDGGSGADVMKGGLGNDIYIVDDIADVVNETPTVDTRFVSTDAAGAQANSSSMNGQFSADGRHVLFESSASNLGDRRHQWFSQQFNRQCRQ